MKKIFLILILLVLTVIESNANQCNLIKSSLAKAFVTKELRITILHSKVLYKLNQKVLNLAISMIFMRLN